MSAVVISRFHARSPANVSGGATAAGRNAPLQPRSPPPAVLCAARAPTARPPRFEDAILPHLDAAYNLARWLAHDPAEAEDVVQDACLRALQFFASFHGDSGRAWLLRIVRNTVYSRLRSRRRRAEVACGPAANGNDNGLLFLEIADPDPGPDAILERAQEVTQLKAAMALLPIDLRECLVLRELEELSYSEIARVTEVPIGTVMSRLHRARRQLTAMWTENALGPAATPSA